MALAAVAALAAAVAALAAEPVSTIVSAVITSEKSMAVVQKSKKYMESVGVGFSQAGSTFPFFTFLM